MTLSIEVAKLKAAWYYVVATFVLGFILGSLRG
jgi:hypothetical protein